MTQVKRVSLCSCVLVLLCTFLFVVPVFAQANDPFQVIDNGDFEICTPPVMTGTGTVTNFTYGSGGGGIGAFVIPTMQCRDDGTDPRFTRIPATLGGRANTGHRAVYAVNNGTPGGTFSFAFVFSKRMAASPGDIVTFSSFYRYAGFAVGADKAEFKIEYFDAANNQLREDKPVGAAAPFNANGDLVTNGAGQGTITFSSNVNGVPTPAPAGTASILVTVVMVDEGGGAGEIFFDSLVINRNYSFNVEIASSHANVTRAQPFVISGKVTNSRAVPIYNAQIVLDVPSGLQYVANSARVDGNGTQIQDGSIVLNLGQVSWGETRSFSYVLMPSIGAEIGKSYEIRMQARDNQTGEFLAHSNRVVVRVAPELMFDLGTIIGKVYNDKNENGWQDKGEEGVAMVRLVTEQGMVVVTDRDGKYHIPGVEPGRHVVKVDPYTLPDGTKFVTEQTFYVKVTEGLLAKANFAIKLPESERLPEELEKAVKFRVVPDDNTAKPVLKIDMENPLVYIAHGQTKHPIRFFMSSNFNAIIHHWKIEVRDETGKVMWEGIGEGAPPGEVVWDGRDNKGNLLAGDEVYSYRLMVSDAKFREDWTDLKLFRTVSMKVGEESFPGINLPTAGYFKMARYGKRDISHNSYHSVKVVGKVLEDPDVVDLHISDESVSVDKDGTFVHDAFLPSGESELLISTTNKEGDLMTYADTVALNSTQFFLVGLMEGSYQFNSYNLNRDTVGNSKQYSSVNPDGRIALYGRIRWKDWLRATVSYDSDGKSGEGILFTNWNPLHLYQTYGDDSKINYDAFNSQDNFYILVEADKSFLKWGNFNTAFDDFELSQYNRTLQGLKVHYESPKTTVYGEPKADITGFEGTARQFSDHNEFRGTGGSLYYLRNINVIEGSEKVKVQIRDRTTNMITQEKDLFYGRDYTINYDEGQIILTEPLSSTVENDTIVQNLIQGGDAVYLIVDYEFQPSRTMFVDGFRGGVRGIKGHLAFGDTINVRLGGLYVEDKTLEPEHGNKIRGISADIKAFFNTRVRMEYAEQNGLLGDNEYSYDGGVNFVNESLARTSRAKAYFIKAESQPIKHLSLSGYYQWVSPFFSNSEIVSQRGVEKYGMEAQYRLTPHWSVRFRHDNQVNLKAKQPDVVQTALATPFFEDAQGIRTTQVQTTYEKDKLLMVAEYKNQVIRHKVGPNTNVFDQLIDDSNNFSNGFGAKVAYKFNEKFTPYVRGQIGLGTKVNNQVSVGINSQINDRVSGFVEQTVGNIGDATRVGFETRVNEDTTSYMTFGVENAKSLQDRIFRSTVGTATDIADRHRIYTERQLSGYRSAESFSDSGGYRAQWTDNFFTDFRFERAEIYESGNIIDRNAGSLQVGYNLNNRLNSMNKFEIRYDRSNQKIFQWLYKGELGWKINQDWSHKTRLEFHRTRETNINETLGQFIEFATGFAYRPIENDRLNMLFNYSYSHIMPLDLQYSTIFAPDAFHNFGTPTTEHTHRLSIEGIYDINKYFSIVQKGALKRTSLDSTMTDPAAVFEALWVSRVNFHITRKWDIAVEYRIRFAREDADASRQGLLVELDREIMEYIRLGVGFNFTDFSDDIERDANYNNRGFFVRMSGKF